MPVDVDEIMEEFGENRAFDSHRDDKKRLKKQDLSDLGYEDEDGNPVAAFDEDGYPIQRRQAMFDTEFWSSPRV